MTLLHDRPTWDQYFKQLVEITSTRSSCERLNVGCMFIKHSRSLKPLHQLHRCFSGFRLF